MGDPVDPAEINRKNRLAYEKSPYLLQHATNPVDWYPWGDDAFDRAMREDKPVFLSIGYSACHWCHVMEVESFRNPHIAAILNRSFIAVKVDREERPDIDAVYLAACQVMTGSGGWPLTLLLTPSRIPFFASTYLPPEGKMGIHGLADILTATESVWKEDREQIQRTSEWVGSVLSRSSTAPDTPPGREDPAARAVSSLLVTFDQEAGGFGRTFKFPLCPTLRFLLWYGSEKEDRIAHQMAMTTLKSLSRGGIRDHLDGGFHRYTTDPSWHSPHFEKMLYDQAMISLACTDAWLITRDPEMKRVVYGCLGYILKNLLLPGGAFASSEDADSGGEEGGYYLWTKDEVDSLLPPDTTKIFWQSYSLPGEGPGAKVKTRGQTLYRRGTIEETARLTGLDIETTGDLLRAAENALLNARSHRPRPARDDKVLTDWNSLAALAFTYAGLAFTDRDYIRVAERCLSFILTALRTDGRLHHRFREGQSAIPALAGDYVCLVRALLAIHQATGDDDTLAIAREILEEGATWCADHEYGGWFTPPLDLTGLPVRQKNSYDDVTPSVNAILHEDLAILSLLTGDRSYDITADHVETFLLSLAAQSPSSHLAFLMSRGIRQGKTYRVGFTGDSTDPVLQEMRQALQTVYAPHVIISPNKANPGFTSPPPSGRPSVTICSNRACLPPVYSSAELLRIIGKDRNVPQDQE